MKLYIAVLDEFPDYMTPTLVAHAVLGFHVKIVSDPTSDLCVRYHWYLRESFKKVVVRVNQKEFDKISNLEDVFLAHENKTLGGKESCAVWLEDDYESLPNVLKYAKLWKPKESNNG